MTTWTIKKLLEWITEYLKDKGVDSPRFATELLLSHVLEMKRIELYTNYSKPVAKPDLDKLHKLVKRAAENEPIQYLVGRTQFYSLEIQVSPACLIPRPETEQLVEISIDFLKTRRGHQKILEPCTGSGCISIALAKNFPDCDIVSTDISESALSVAEKNIENHSLRDQTKLLKGNLYDPLIPEMEDEQFDLIVSNPPYVTNAEYEKLEENVKEYEPRRALLAGEYGTDVIEPLIEKAAEFLKSGGSLIFEIGYQQANLVKQLINENKNFENVNIFKDFQKNDRIARTFKK